MSKIQVRQPVIHTPTFREYSITGLNLSIELQNLGLQYPFGMLDWNYYYTDLEGWGKILYDLVFKSSLYKKDRFDCDNYALKCMTLCAERYGLNTMAMVIGNTPLGRHAWNMFFTGTEFMCFEPNASFSFTGDAFKIGEHKYFPEWILI